MKKGPDALVTAENESGRVKHENGTLQPRYTRKRVRMCKTCKRDPTHLAPLKMNSRAQNMKTGLVALSTAENEYERAKHENGTRRPLYPRKCVRERKT
jgi:hypothetical protein